MADPEQEKPSTYVAPQPEAPLKDQLLGIDSIDLNNTNFSSPISFQVEPLELSGSVLSALHDPNHQSTPGLFKEDPPYYPRGMTFHIPAGMKERELILDLYRAVSRIQNPATLSSSKQQYDSIRQLVESRDLVGWKSQRNTPVEPLKKTFGLSEPGPKQRREELRKTIVEKVMANALSRGASLEQMTALKGVVGVLDEIQSPHYKLEPEQTITTAYGERKVVGSLDLRTTTFTESDTAQLLTGSGQDSRQVFWRIQGRKEGDYRNALRHNDEFLDGVENLRAALRGNVRTRESSAIHTVSNLYQQFRESGFDPSQFPLGEMITARDGDPLHTMSLVSRSVEALLEQSGSTLGALDRERLQAFVGVFHEKRHERYKEARELIRELQDTELAIVDWKRDFSDRKQSQKKRFQLEQELKTFFDNLPSEAAKELVVTDCRAFFERNDNGIPRYRAIQALEFLHRLSESEDVGEITPHERTQEIPPSLAALLLHQHEINKNVVPGDINSELVHSKRQEKFERFIGGLSDDYKAALLEELQEYMARDPEKAKTPVRKAVFDKLLKSLAP